MVRIVSKNKKRRDVIDVDMSKNYQGEYQKAKVDFDLQCENGHKWEVKGFYSFSGYLIVTQGCSICPECGGKGYHVG